MPGERAWWDGPLVGFDLETTAPDPFEARIVTAAVVTVHPAPDGERRRPFDHREWLADPGVPIPEGATEVHGITTERAQAEGRPPVEVIAELLAVLRAELERPAPIVIFNARYDLTVLECERVRHGLDALPSLRSWPIAVVDPLVLDKWLHRYRKGSRKLDAQAAHYGADLTDAHDAYADALAAARVAWCIATRGRVIRRVRNGREARELNALEREWEEVRYDLARLHDAQRRWALAERDRFAEYKASIGDHETAERVRAEVGWPILEPLVVAP